MLKIDIHIYVQCKNVGKPSLQCTALADVAFSSNRDWLLANDFPGNETALYTQLIDNTA